MDILLTIAVMTWLAGMTAWLGGWLAYREHSPETELKSEIIHGVVAFGGGILVSAVAFALLPAGIENLSILSVSLAFLAGGVMFCFIDQYLAKRGGQVSQFLALLMDFVPEALALGAVFASNNRLGFLLAGFIALQNLPEGFNAYREMVKSHTAPRKVLVMLFLASVLGPLAAIAGHLLLRDQMEITASIMTFASGGILYLIFQDIAPQATIRNHWSPPLGAVLGFLLGLVGHMAIHT